MAYRAACPCSTPFGVTVFFTPTRHEPSQSTSGAQRLSASLSSSPAHCVTRVGQDGRCSTPFGVTVFFTAVPFADPPAYCECSTPFGVTVFFTVKLPSPVTLPVVCSTPFGVTVFFTAHRRSTATGTRGLVLNAFRRHCLLHLQPQRRVNDKPECSTPFGVTVFFTPARSRSPPRCRRSGAQRLSASLSSSRARRPGPLRATHVLNAFRRHCLLHVSTAAQSMPRSQCSTPFGVTVFFTLKAVVGNIPMSSVLNAFRRHCLLHRAAADLHAADRRCSTPFGVTVFFTPVPGPVADEIGRCSTPFGVTVFFTTRTSRRSCWPRGAQRLSASLSSSLSCWKAPMSLSRCSTPFGVTVFFTLTTAAPLVPSGTGCSTPFGVTVFFTGAQSPTGTGSTGAQRLSASLSSSRDTARPAALGPSCAQRLSASLSSSLVTGSTARDLVPVLNAFRRHCLLHTRSGAGWFRPVRCSTPFGVTVFFTRRAPSGSRSPVNCAQRLSASLSSSLVDHQQVGGRAVVLNAFRRHCLLHGAGSRAPRPGPRAQRLSASLSSSQIPRDTLAIVIGCSTPFGVTVFFTATRTTKGISPGCAQRLSASLSSSPVTSGQHRLIGLCSTPFGVTVFFTQLLSSRLQNLTVLNAFRRHCLLHNSRPSICARLIASAQRLSASLSSSRRVTSWNSVKRECSTPFGVTVFFTTWPCSPSCRGSRCAQRLSASLSSSRGGGRRAPGRSRCAQRLSASLSSSPVPPLLERFFRGSAQRLSASLSSSRWSASPPRWATTSAQRLSASLSSSHFSTFAVLGGIPFVLNAFRRHCLLHAAQLRADGLRRRRAQRLSASLSSSRPPNSGGRRGVRVLNAFRRHCLLHGRFARQRASAAGAQRLSASLSSSLVTFAQLRVWGACSTPFGVTVFFTPVRFRVLPSSGGAQRLSASLSSSRVSEKDRQELTFACSTPFGVTVFFTFLVEP